MTRTPGIFESAPETSTWSCCVVFLRSSQGFVIIPENPPVGEVIWNVAFISGKPANTSWICLVKSCVWSSVALGAAWTTANTTLWSSVGASSFCENM